MASFIGLAAVGLFDMLHAGGRPHPLVAPPPAPALQAVSLWLLMRAFAAGCSAMTGVEAVANAVGAFKAPVERQAQRTLTVICAVLGLLLVAVALLAPAYGLQAMDQSKPGYQSVLSQVLTV